MSRRFLMEPFIQLVQTDELMEGTATEGDKITLLYTELF